MEEAAGGTCSGINKKTIPCHKDECTIPGIPLLYISDKVVIYANNLSLGSIWSVL